MKLIDVLTSPWAILPEKLVEIQEIYKTHLRGERIDLAAVEAALGRPLDNQVKPYRVDRGVATIFIDGVIAKRMNIFMKISGGTSSELAMKDFRQALADPDVHTILFNVDSPGGAVDGTQELAQEVARSRGAKEIVAFTDGLMASAAYWIASAADRIYISSDTVSVGSIGVVARHVDYSRALEQDGIKVTEITAGKYKRTSSAYEPLSERGRRTIQDELDYIYGVFLRDVAAHRGLSLETVKDDRDDSIPWADGRVFLGRQAMGAGLVDGVSTLVDLQENLAKHNGSYVSRVKIGEAAERRTKRNGTDA